jgi:hypothetical protein
MIARDQASRAREVDLSEAIRLEQRLKKILNAKFFFRGSIVAAMPLTPATTKFSLLVLLFPERGMTLKPLFTLHQSLTFA